MRLPFTLTIVMLIFQQAIASTNELNSSDNFVAAYAADWDLTTDKLIEQRINNMDLPFDPVYSDHVRYTIQRYIKNGMRDAEAMLGRTPLYFPIFEHYLRLYDLPDELKYLPMVESTLRPSVNSHAGAAGLWQLMPMTARYFGLTVNDQVDERLDPYKSTEVAVKYLAQLYNEFQDWPLVMAAYNAGAGRIRKAIRLANCDNYWEIQAYLPKESRKYVPGYIAAAYLVNYYNDHNLQPKYPSWELQDTHTFIVYNNFWLSSIAKQCGVSLAVLRRLNPSYRSNLVSADRDGNKITIPAHASNKFRAMLDKKTNSSFVQPEGTYETSYIVMPGDELSTLALVFNTDEENIMAWNHLRTHEIVVNQPLKLYLPYNAYSIRP